VGVGYGLHDGLKREVLGAWADAILAEFDVTPRGQNHGGSASVLPSVEDEHAYTKGYRRGHHAATRAHLATLPSVEDVARVLAEHEHDVTSYDAWDLHGCDCGWEVPDDDDKWSHYRAHLARAVLALFPGRTEAVYDEEEA